MSQGSLFSSTQLIDVRPCNTFRCQADSWTYPDDPEYQQHTATSVQSNLTMEKPPLLNEYVALVRGFSMGFSIARFGCRHLWRLFHSDHWTIRFAKKKKEKQHLSIQPSIHPYICHEIQSYMHTCIYIYI